MSDIDNDEDYPSQSYADLVARKEALRVARARYRRNVWIATVRARNGQPQVKKEDRR